jgi:hypothetical protein
MGVYYRRFSLVNELNISIINNIAKKKKEKMDKEDLFASQNPNIESSDDEENGLQLIIKKNALMLRILVTVDESKINYYKNFNISTKEIGKNQ